MQGESLIEADTKPEPTTQTNSCFRWGQDQLIKCSGANTSVSVSVMEQQYYLDQDGVAYALVEAQQVI